MVPLLVQSTPPLLLLLFAPTYFNRIMEKDFYKGKLIGRRGYGGGGGGGRTTSTTATS